MTQEQVAEAMGTTQAAIARLESGKVLPSTRTLERFAKATRTRFRISFEPDREATRCPPTPNTPYIPRPLIAAAIIPQTATGNPSATRSLQES
jgi:transcriptional regulator with XRE-family HTH domain